MAVEAVERAGMKEDGQGVAAVLGPAAMGIFGKTCSGAAGADPASHAIGGQRVVVSGELGAGGACMLGWFGRGAAESAISHAVRGDPAGIDTQPAGCSARRLGRCFRQAKRLAAAPVGLHR